MYCWLSTRGKRLLSRSFIDYLAVFFCKLFGVLVSLHRAIKRKILGIGKPTYILYIPVARLFFTNNCFKNHNSVCVVSLTDSIHFASGCTLG